MEHSILIVDDDIGVCNSLASLLKRDNYHVTTSTSPSAALEVMAKQEFSLIISDQRMPKMCGTELLKQVKHIYPQTLRILISAYTDYDALIDSINEADIYKFLAKPWHNNILLKEIRVSVNHIEMLVQERMLTALYKNSVEAMFILDQQECIVMANPAFCLLMMQDEAQLKGKSINELIANRDGSTFQIEPMLKDAGNWQGELQCIKDDNHSVLPIQCTITRLINQTACGKNLFAFMFLDITELKHKEEKIKHMAFHDALTDLPNRRALSFYLDQKILESKRHKTSLCILFVDLDNFKSINDNYGHDFGDKVIQLAAERIKGELRCSDMIARIGGDEFVAVLPDCVSEFSSARIAQNFNSAISKPMEINGQHVCVSSSIGVSEINDYSETADNLLIKADQAMYEAKRNGKNTFAYAANDNSNVNQDDSFTSQEISQAIGLDQFVSYYQAIVNVCTHKTVGYEALARWQHPEKGVITPEFFIPQAVDSGIIDHLDSHLIEKSIGQAELLYPLIDSEAPLYLSVNVSAQHLEQKFFVDNILSNLDKIENKNFHLQLELTETSLIHSIDNCAAMLSELREEGIKVAIDDFGTGYSSLSYINKLPIDTIKIDHSFVSEIETSGRARKIIQNVLDLSSELNILTIAEGVEQEVQIEYLLKHGCFCMQGYYYSKPLPIKHALVYRPAATQKRWSN